MKSIPANPTASWQLKFDQSPNHPDQVAQVRASKEKALGFLVGQVFKKTQGQANPAVVNEVIRGKI